MSTMLWNYTDFHCLCNNHPYNNLHHHHNHLSSGICSPVFFLWISNSMCLHSNIAWRLHPQDWQFSAGQDHRSHSPHQCWNEYSNIFKYSNICFRILIFVFNLWTLSESEYYSNIRIFWSEYSEIIWWKNTWIF